MNETQVNRLLKKWMPWLFGAAILFVAFILIREMSGTTYTVTFDSMGGTPVESVEIKGGSFIKKTPVPEKERARFAFWGNKEGFRYIFPLKVTDNMTLYAYYQDLFYVDFADYEGVWKTVPVYDGELIPAIETPPAPEKHIFKEWTRDGYPFDFTLPVTCDMTVEAAYELYIPCEVLSVPRTSYRTAVGTSTSFRVTVGPEDTTDLLTWSSDNEKVASVTEENGVFTLSAKTKGTATIHFVCGGKKLDVTVSVYKPVLAVTLTGPATVGTEKTVKLSASVSPSDADYDGFTFESTKPSVATVDSQGVVTGVSPGVTEIVCRAGDVEGRYKITVFQTSWIELDPTYYLDVDETVTVTPILDPEIAKWDITYSLADSSLCTLNGSRITGKAPGKTTLTVTVSNGKRSYKASSVLSVNGSVFTVKINSYSNVFTAGQTVPLTGSFVLWQDGVRTETPLSELGQVTCHFIIPGQASLATFSHGPSFVISKAADDLHEPETISVCFSSGGLTSNSITFIVEPTLQATGGAGITNITFFRDGSRSCFDLYLDSLENDVYVYFTLPLASPPDPAALTTAVVHPLSANGKEIHLTLSEFSDPVSRCLGTFTVTTRSGVPYVLNFYLNP